MLFNQYARSLSLNSGLYRLLIQNTHLKEMSGCSHRWQTPCVARWRYPQSFGWCSEQKQEVCPFQRQEALSNRQGRCSMALLSSLYLIPVSLSRQSGIGPHAQDQTQHRTLTRRLAVPLVEISSCSSGDWRQSVFCCSSVVLVVIYCSPVVVVV